MSLNQKPRQGCPHSTKLLVPCCFPTDKADAASVHSRIDGTIWWLYIQWPRISVFSSSLKFLVQITETRLATRLTFTPTPMPSTLQARFCRSLKKPSKMFWTILLTFHLKKQQQTNSCISCLMKLLPWQLAVESSTQRISNLLSQLS